MIPEKIQALFKFIDYLDANKREYIEKYLPLCEELNSLDIQRSKLKPRDNYNDKLRYDVIQQEIAEKFQPITKNIYIPALNKLRELEIWDGDDVFTSIWNNNISAIYDLKENFTSEDADKVKVYKQKYIGFRNETNSNFLCLQLVFSSLDEILKELFDFFKDTNENEFESFETKTIKVNSIKEAVEGLKNTKGSNVAFSLPQESLFDYQNVRQYQQQLPSISKEIIMGDKIQIGDIANNSGQIIIGKDIRLLDSMNGKNETAEMISRLIGLIRREQIADEELKQSLITNFDKVKEELSEEQPSKSKIFKWLTNTKGVLENLVLSHEVAQAVDWVYRNLNFAW